MKIYEEPIMEVNEFYLTNIVTTSQVEGENTGDGGWIEM